MIEENDLQINKSQPPSPETASAKSLDLPRREEEDHEVVNVHGVLGGLHFVLVVALIVASMASVWTRTGQVHQHQRYMRMYFNLNLLGMDNRGIYEDSDNIDESSTQFAIFTDQRNLMVELVNVSNSYTQDGIVEFVLKEGEPIVSIEPIFLNGSFGFLEFGSVDEVMQYFMDFQGEFLRDFMLSVSSVTVTSRLGNSKFANNYQIIADISIHAGFMMEVEMNYEYQSIEPDRATRVSGLRTFEQALAGVLLFLFLYRLVEIRIEGKADASLGGQKQVIREKYMKWYLFLCLSNLLVLLSWVLSPMGAWIQLLPLFQFPDKHEDDRDAFNFNKNVRYSMTLILKIWLPLLLFLNGYVCFAVLMFADSDGAYFGDFFSAFFDYLYQMYQCGIYQIFVQMQQYGYIADIFYFFLFFYVFMAGSTLITAFFVTLIQFKLNEKEIAFYTRSLMKTAACPNCMEENHYNIDQKTIDIMVSSPKLSPLVKDKSILHSPHHSAASFKPNTRSRKDGSEIKVFIQHSGEGRPGASTRYKLGNQLVGYSKKVQGLLRQIENRIRAEKDKEELEQTLAVLYRYELPISWRSA